MSADDGSGDAEHAPLMHPADIVTGRIIARYANPERRNYCYLFRLKPEADFQPLVPSADAVIGAWLDEGEGMAEVSIEEAIRRCAAAIEAGKGDALRKVTRLSTGRVIHFSVLSTAARDGEEVAIHLLSRSLFFSPKGDREVRELWRRSAEGAWYSAYRRRDRSEEGHD